MLTHAARVNVSFCSKNQRISETNSEMVELLKTVEKSLHYEFKNIKLLEEALTHPSCTETTSYDRLEFLGDAAIGLAITNYLFLAYPDLDQGQLSLLRAANVSTEKLARSAVKHCLHRFLQHSLVEDSLQAVTEFAMAVDHEDELELYAGAVKAPKVLADIVESVAAAVYVDCGFDLKACWSVFELLLSPFVTLEALNSQPQPVTKLFEYCQKNKKDLSLKFERDGDFCTTARVLVDGQLVGSASEKNKFLAKCHAAKAALEKLSVNKDSKCGMDLIFELNPNSGEIDSAKSRLFEICGKKKWAMPIFRVHREIGPPHDRRFVCSVQLDELLVVGDHEKSKIRDAENSVATKMILGLQNENFL